MDAMADVSGPQVKNWVTVKKKGRTLYTHTYTLSHTHTLCECMYLHTYWDFHTYIES